MSTTISSLTAIMSMNHTTSTIMSASAVLPNIQRELIRYVYSTFMAVGLVSCLLNIALFLRRQFRLVSCCIYFLLVNVAWTIILLLGGGSTLYGLMFDDPTFRIRAFCKVRYYFLQSLGMMYRWAMVGACFDRYALSSTDARLRRYATVERAYRVLTVIVCLWIVLPIQIPIFFELANGRCGIFNNAIAAFYHSTFTALFGGFLPPVCMLIFSLLIYQNLRAKQQLQQSNNNSQHSNQHASRKQKRVSDRQVLAMLITQVLTYVVINTPSMCFAFYSAATIHISKSDDRLSIERFISFLVETLLYSYPGLLFFLYTFSSCTFRQELVRMITNRPMATAISSSVRTEKRAATSDGYQSVNTID